MKKILSFLLVLSITFSFAYPLEQNSIEQKQKPTFLISGNIVDVVNNKIYPGTIYVENGYILKIEQNNKVYEDFIMPGFIDAHVHIESSLLPPAEFARIATVHGTVATVSDSHEIANVLGIPGIEYMIANSKQVPFKFYFSAPSCVPATKPNKDKINKKELADAPLVNPILFPV